MAKRPVQIYGHHDGHPIPLGKSDVIEEAQILFRKVLECRGIEAHGPKVCERCGFSAGKRELFVIHHRHYETLGKERPQDVCLLCKPCHTQIHELAKKYELTVSDIPFVNPSWEKMIRTGYKPKPK